MDIVEAVRNGRLLDFLAGRIDDLGVLVMFASLIFVRKLWWHAIAMLLLATGPIGWLSRSLG